MRRIPRTLPLAVGAWFTAALVFAGRAAAQAAPAWTHVTYISGPTVYVDAGTRAGLATGAHLAVRRDTTFVAELAVQYISSSSAACTVVRGSALAVAVGDSAQFVPAAAAAVAAPGQPTATLPARTPAAAVRPWADRLRGHIGVRYLTIDPGTGPAGVMSQPAFDLRLDGSHLDGSAFGMSVDVRAQRSILPPPDSAHPAPTFPLDVNRVYTAALRWNPVGSPATVTIGRQFSSSSTSVGLFDGVALDYARAHWSAGAFAGLQPSWYTFAFSDSTREYGAYVQWHNGIGSTPIWSLTAGGVGAYTMGQIDREFTYATAMVAASRFTAYLTQEVDVNRGWRAAAEHAAVTPTSTFGTVQFSVTDAFSLNAGIDNRRNVRLYTDFLNPEAAFDNGFRQGVWGGATMSLNGRFRVSGEARRTSGGAAGVAQSYTGSAGVTRLTPLDLGFHVRDTHYTGQLSAGDLQSLSAEANPFGLVHLEATGGLRASTPTALGLALGSSHVTWTSFDADWAVGRSIYLMVSAYRELGSGARNAQNFVSIAYRF